jgi:hypothetical protein
MLCDTAVFQGLHNTDVSIVQLDIFAYQSDIYFFCRMTQSIYHSFPVFQIRIRAVKLQAVADNLCQMFFFHGKRCFVEIFHIKILQNMVTWHVTEQCDLVLDAIVKRQLGTAHDHIRLNSHTLELLYAGLCRLGFHFT